MQALSTKYAMGISIDQVQLKNINPPEPVQESFNEVNQAQQEKEKLINEARRDYNKVIPLAEGEKDQRIREADGYRLKRINEAEGDVARFSACWPSTPRRRRSHAAASTSRPCRACCPAYAPRSSSMNRPAGYSRCLNLDSHTGERSHEQKRPDALLVVVGIGAYLAMSALYTVSEVEQVIITQFGKPVGDPVTSAGLKIKVPFIQDINPIDKRVLEWDGSPSDMPTKDKLYISVDLFARWRITDPLQYFLRLRDERSAQSRLDDILGSETRNAVAKHELIEIIRTTKDREPLRDALLTDAERTSTWVRSCPSRRGANSWSRRSSLPPPRRSGSLASSCSISDSNGSTTTKACVRRFTIG
jgi:regulator of protease activity HflC (stomatin/prohibitin superfamily)